MIKKIQSIEYRSTVKSTIILVLLLLINQFLFAQEVKVVQLIHADSLVGKLINGESVRILNGNVQLIQNDIYIFCNKGVQYLGSNKAELEGNVKIAQDDVIITAPKGFYFGNTKKAFGRSGIVLKDGKVTLTADSGEYFFDEKKAIFIGNVKLFNDSTTLISNQLTYFTEIEKAIAIGYVKIVQPENTITADTLVYFRRDEVSIADGNVFITNKNNNIKIYYDHLENYEQKKEGILTGRPLLFQIDTTDSGAIDTLLIVSKRMEAFRGEKEIYSALDSVEIWRSGFSSKNNFTQYFKKEGKILSRKINDENDQPIFWYNENQSYGDSILIFVEESKLKEALIFGSSFLISRDSMNLKRFNQLNGKYIKIDFDSNSIKSVFVKGNALSIYYLYDMDEPNGLNKASGDSLIIFLSNNKVNEIKFFGNPEGEFHPEELILNKENDFKLSGFKWTEDRPTKNEILRSRFKFDKKEIDIHSKEPQPVQK